MQPHKARPAVTTFRSLDPVPLPMHRRSRRRDVEPRGRRVGSRAGPWRRLVADGGPIERPAAETGGPRLAASEFRRDRNLVRRDRRRSRSSPVDAESPRLRGQALHSQVDLHAAYGGVVPELASRDHIRRVLPLLRRSSRRRGQPSTMSISSPTPGAPGLAGALLVGAGVACSIAAALGRPAVGVHHLEGHLLVAFPLRRSARVPVRRAARLGRPYPAASTSPTSAATSCSATRSTTPPARHSTSRPSCSASAIPAARRWRGWPSSATPTPSPCRGRCSQRDRSTSRSPA